MTGNTSHEMIRGSIFNYNRSFFKPISWPKLKKRLDRLHEKTDKLIAKVKSEKLRSEAKIKSEQLTSADNSRNLPSNVTIREEYVKCGKPGCSRCKHGPYFFAYWRDNHKLRKKYIGKYRPPLENQQ